MNKKSTLAVHPVSSAEAFSRAAPLYEGDEEVNPIARWARRRSLATLDAAFRAGDCVIEIGCGTGTEATHLARRGVTVVATDAAPGMVATVAGKIAPGGPAGDLAGRVVPRLLPAHRIGELLEEYGPASFDGAYSSMGPLNCEPSLYPVAEGLAALVR